MTETACGKERLTAAHVTAAGPCPHHDCHLILHRTRLDGRSLEGVNVRLVETTEDDWHDGRQPEQLEVRAVSFEWVRGLSSGLTADRCFGDKGDIEDITEGMLYEPRYLDIC